MPENNPQKSIFSAEALKSRRAKEIGLPSVFLRLPTASTILIIFSCALAGLGWALFAKIPIKVPGRGVVVNINDVKPLITKVDGRILVVTPEVSAIRKTLDRKLFDFYNDSTSSDNYTVDDLIGITKAVLNDTNQTQYSNISKLVQNAAILNDISSARFTAQKGQVVTIVFNEKVRSQLGDELISLEKNYQTNTGAIKRNQLNIAAYNLEAKDAQSLIDATRYLADLGAQTKFKVAEERTKYNEVVRKIRTLNNDNEQLRQKNDTLAIELQSKLTEYINSVYVFAEETGYITSMAKGNGQYAEINQPILFFSRLPSTSLPDLIVGFTDEKSANLITDGMKVVATPEGVNKSQYGGINGRITTTLPYTLTSERLSTIVGIESIRDLASQDTRAPNLTVIKLAKNSNGEGYEWTTKQIPPSKTNIGDVLNLDIHVDSQTPLMMAIPFIKKYLGLEGPTDFKAPR